MLNENLLLNMNATGEVAFFLKMVMWSKIKGIFKIIE
jgi:hypothetical protein